MLDLIDALFDAILDFMWGAGSMFYRGVAAGVILSVIAALVYKEIIRDRKKIHFFLETIEPSLKSSPSGFSRMMGCMGGILRLGALLIMILLLVSGCLRSVAVP